MPAIFKGFVYVHHDYTARPSSCEWGCNWTRRTEKQALTVIHFYRLSLNYYYYDHIVAAPNSRILTRCVDRQAACDSV